uniref:Major outer membrane protein n=1 Tax=Histophilus somni TaxID=731 RepID=A0A3G9DVB1_HISSO|nr:major outer membrane protein [Histophilus somni]
MKKTLVALAVAAVAASASATTVYNQNGTKVEVGGRLDVVLGEFGKNQHVDLRNNDSRLEFKVEHEIQNGLKALGFYRLGLGGLEGNTEKQNTFDDLNTKKLWLGLEQADIGRLTFGKQDTTADAVQMNDHAYIFGGNNNLFTSDNKVVSFRSADWKLAEGQTFGFGLDYGFGNSDKTAKNEAKDTYGVSVFYAGQFGDLTAGLNAGYTHERNKVEKTVNSNRSSWRVATQVGFNSASFGVEYGQSKHANSKEKKLLVGAKYGVLPEVANLYAQYQHNKEDNQKAAKVYIVGADYAFNKNVVAYAEFANKRQDDKENKYAAGLRVYF